MNNSSRFSRLVFLIAGIWGMIVIVPGFFGEKTINAQDPPAISHPEYYYGFMGAALAWQIGFLIIAAGPARLRPLIPAAIAEKMVYAVSVAVLFAAGRAGTPIVIFAAVDLLFGVLFTVAYFKLGKGESAVAKTH